MLSATPVLQMAGVRKPCLAVYYFTAPSKTGSVSPNPAHAKWTALWRCGWVVGQNLGFYADEMGEEWTKHGHHYELGVSCRRNTTENVYDIFLEKGRAHRQS